MDKAPDTHGLGDWVSSRADLEASEKKKYLAAAGKEFKAPLFSRSLLATIPTVL
jgi:hypothetical protein